MQFGSELQHSPCFRRPWPLPESRCISGIKDCQCSTVCWCRACLGKSLGTALLREDDHSKHIPGKWCSLTGTAPTLVHRNSRKKSCINVQMGLKRGRKKIAEFLAVASLKPKLHAHVQQTILGYWTWFCPQNRRMSQQFSFQENQDDLLMGLLKGSWK